MILVVSYPVLDWALPFVKRETYRLLLLLLNFQDHLQMTFGLSIWIFINLLNFYILVILRLQRYPIFYTKAFSSTLFFIISKLRPFCCFSCSHFLKAAIVTFFILQSPTETIEFYFRSVLTVKFFIVFCPTLIATWFGIYMSCFTYPKFHPATKNILPAKPLVATFQPPSRFLYVQNHWI